MPEPVVTQGPGNDIYPNGTINTGISCVGDCWKSGTPDGNGNYFDKCWDNTLQDPDACEATFGLSAGGSMKYVFTCSTSEASAGGVQKIGTDFKMRWWASKTYYPPG